MGFDGACIGTLRKLTPEQVKEVVEILNELRLKENIQKENQKMILDPLGYDAIKDIDEIHSRNRRRTDDPYLKATSEKMAHHFPKIDDAERR